MEDKIVPNPNEGNIAMIVKLPVILQGKFVAHESIKKESLVESAVWCDIFEKYVTSTSQRI